MSLETQTPDPVTAPPIRRRPSLLALLPLVAFLLLAALFTRQLFFGGDASRIPSALIGKPAPSADLPPLDGIGRPGLTAASLRAGHVTLVNVFASWCVPCRTEHPLLMRLAQDRDLAAAGLQIAGISYKDEPEQSKTFLAKGNPFALIGVDRPGRAAIDWGVYGVPETVIVRGDGTIAYKLVGEITAENIDTVLVPKIREAMR